MADSAAFGFGRDAPGQYVLIRDEKAGGTDGGTFTQDVWQTRDLNTKVVDQTGQVALSSNQFTLPAGTYRITARTPAYDVTRHKCRLRNITDGTTELVGTASYSIQTSAADAANQVAEVLGQFTITSPKVFEIQHYSSSTRATNGFGVGGIVADGEIEIYTVVELFRVTNAALVTPIVPTQYALLRDEKASATNGGTFDSGAWRTRDLNTEVTDEIGITLAANQFTLPAGTYRINASAPVHKTNRHQVRLQNITDVATELTGESGLASAADSTVVYSRLKGTFTIASSKTFELQNQAQTTQATDGFGVAGSFGTEVYAVVELEKVA